MTDYTAILAENPEGETHLIKLCKATAEFHLGARTGSGYEDIVGVGLVANTFICEICEQEWPCEPYKRAVGFLTDSLMSYVGAVETAPEPE